MIRVAVCNDSTVLSDTQVAAIVVPLQTQVSRDFCPIYGVDAQLAFLPKGCSPPPECWALVISDNADQPGTLGYHSTKQALPWGIVGAADDVRYGNSVSVTISHELLEMLANPYVQKAAIIDSQFGGLPGGSAAALAYEVADAVESDALSYCIGGVSVSNFVLPWWFGGDVPDRWAEQYSFTPACQNPFGLDASGKVRGLCSGGYIGIRQFQTVGGWGTVNAQRFAAFSSAVNVMLPPEQPHILREDGTTQTVYPKFSRKARILQHLSA